MGSSTEFRDRIRELRRVPAGELRANPKNWRVHPKAQHDAVRGVLVEIGYADAPVQRAGAGLPGRRSGRRNAPPRSAPADEPATG